MVKKYQPSGESVAGILVMAPNITYMKAYYKILSVTVNEVTWSKVLHIIGNYDY